MKDLPLGEATSAGYEEHDLYLCDHDTGLYHEGYFKDMLCLERKRTERSKRPFLLMTLHIKRVLHTYRKDELIRKIAGILLSVTREVDVKGWFKYDSVMGVIFTEINTIDTDIIRKKISDSLSLIMDVAHLGKIDIHFYLFPEDQEKVELKRAPNFNFYPDLSRRNSLRKKELFFKRLLDISGSIAGIAIFSPFFLCLPVLIKLTSKGPVLFRQERVGQFGKKFIFLKFRSMYVNSDPSIHREYIKKFICEQENSAVEISDGDKKGVYKLKNDPRITPLGAFLRKTSLDEIPQFMNVLKGEMSLVGPRPAIPYELENYEIWHRRRVLEVKPGITGLWQVAGRSRTTFDEMVRLDLKYIITWSVWTDIKILFQTLWVVATGKGGY